MTECEKCQELERKLELQDAAIDWVDQYISDLWQEAEDKVKELMNHTGKDAQ